MLKHFAPLRLWRMKFYSYYSSYSFQIRWQIRKQSQSHFHVENSWSLKQGTRAQVSHWVPRAQHLLPAFQLQLPGVSNTISARDTKTWRRHEVAPSKAKHPAIRLTCRSLHLQPRGVNEVAGAVCASCAWEGFNPDGQSSPPGDLGESLPPSSSCISHC